MPAQSILHDIDPDMPQNTIRIGRSELMKKRWSTHNTSVPDNYTLIYCVKVDDPPVVEECIHGILKKYMYRNDKSFYVCPVETIISVFNRCATYIRDGPDTNSFCECKKVY
jgi:hypothetical protein